MAKRRTDSLRKTITVAIVTVSGLLFLAKLADEIPWDLRVSFAALAVFVVVFEMYAMNTLLRVARYYLRKKRGYNPAMSTNKSHLRERSSPPTTFSSRSAFDREAQQ